jgi:hypothetical protein
MSKLISLKRWLMLPAVALAFAGAATSTTIYQVQLNTSALASQIPVGDTLFVDFQLVASDPSVSDSVSLSEFSFGTGGSHTSDQVLSGTVNGSYPTYTLDSDVANYDSELIVGFTPGSLLTFDMSFTSQTSGAGATPDTFSSTVLYYDSPSQTYTSISSSGLQDLVQANLTDGSTVLPQALSADPTFNSITPVITIVTPSGGVPEPATLALFGAGLGLVGWIARKSKFEKILR